MRIELKLRLLVIAVLTTALLVSCTTEPTATPAVKSVPSPKPVVIASPSPAAVSSPVVAPPRSVGGGAAQPRAAITSQPIGASGAIIVPTPNFASVATPQPAPLAPAVALQTIQPAPIVQVSGTLSRIPTAIPPPSGGAGAAVVSAAAAGGSGAATSLLTIGVVATSTPLVRVAPQPQPAIQFPGR